VGLYVRTSPNWTINCPIDCQKEELRLSTAVLKLTEDQKILKMARGVLIALLLIAIPCSCRKWHVLRRAHLAPPSLRLMLRGGSGGISEDGRPAQGSSHFAWMGKLMRLDRDQDGKPVRFVEIDGKNEWSMWEPRQGEKFLNKLLEQCEPVADMHNEEEEADAEEDTEEDEGGDGEDVVTAIQETKSQFQNTSLGLQSGRNAENDQNVTGGLSDDRCEEIFNDMMEQMLPQRVKVMMPCCHRNIDFFPSLLANLIATGLDEASLRRD
jgi:hypothetical protein